MYDLQSVVPMPSGKRRSPNAGIAGKRAPVPGTGGRSVWGKPGRRDAVRVKGWRKGMAVLSRDYYDCTVMLSYEWEESFQHRPPKGCLQIILIEEGCVALRLNQERCFLQAGALLVTAVTIAASLPDWIIRPRSSWSTDTLEPGSRNILELPGGTFQARVEMVTFWSGDSSLLWMALNTTYAVMILVSEAGSIRAVAACEAITWPLVSSSSNQALADRSGWGIDCARAPDMHAVATSRLAANFFINIRCFTSMRGKDDAPAMRAGGNRPPARTANARREALEHAGRGWFKTPLQKHFARCARH